jgi:halimadienyl-diphosphate synthase
MILPGWQGLARSIRELSNHSMEWICENQLPDGSWGAKDVFYYHDRVICTLAAMIALTYRGRRARDKHQIELGLEALERITSGATRGLAADSNGATVGFEMIVPTLVEEAEKLGIIKQQGERILGRLKMMRDIKLEKIKGLKISRHITPAFSSEMVGSDRIDLLDLDDLQERNGSIGNSPAATAHFIQAVRPDDEPAMRYLRSVVRPDGGVPFAAPFDIFERTWVVWNLSLFRNPKDPGLKHLFEPHINHVMQNWDSKQGVSFSETYTPKDADDTTLAFGVLNKFGLDVDIQTVLNYEEEEYFRCYPLESNSSISVNIHALDALKRANFDRNHPTIKKLLRYLDKSRMGEPFWLDKWQTSPYYTTSHAIIAAHGYAFNMCEQAVNWILSTQKADGSWGSIPNLSTAEETAYCIQALRVWDRVYGSVRKGVIEHAVRWLGNNSEPPYPPLWIGKTLYCPENVVRSTDIKCAGWYKWINYEIRSRIAPNNEQTFGCSDIRS